MSTTKQSSAQGKVNPVFSLSSGAFAGAVEGFATYPIEYTKTVAQFSTKAGEKPPNPINIVRETVTKYGVRGLYSGCGALVAGNALKAGVRFLSYDHFKSMLKDEHGKLTAPRSLLAGLGAGMMEAIFAVTPSETIKTKLIDDAKSPKPKYPPNLVAGSIAIGSSRPGQPLPGGVTFGIGAVAGVVTVYATMPLDVVKTRLQTLHGRDQYKGTFDCMAKILRHEGLFAFWRGATPRLARLMLSGGIVFTVYEKSMDLLQSTFA
ncbi:hypothetical protein MGL_0990 [Malassezia globosa CBS 7966]|uniref:Uncharacterized protein n=1 Tax=Malassezia globosa (strain ATCC MYA-4612 / CBS 7966) TaxID=425265 RepID=A8PVZ2_MALGO|nr:uncharacterized protein MGL_0990 [Malassezia globosa CBS 7966]EDP44508.1 hypothetical protein MGL_0990 [Malassezia globosa CBS 7966]